MTVGLTFEVDMEPWFAMLQDIIVIPFRVIGDLEDVLNAAFELTQEQVHVITGSLRASGKPQSHFDGTIWEGDIDYGGSSGGFPHDPVNYAAIEQDRGGDHDFLAGMDQFNADFLLAMEQLIP